MKTILMITAIVGLTALGTTQAAGNAVMMGAGYFNPLKGGGTSALDMGTWWFTHVFFEMKFMTLFSALFVVSVLTLRPGLYKYQVRRNVRTCMWGVVLDWQETG